MTHLPRSAPSPPSDQVYSLTRQGEAELNGAGTKLSPTQLQLLVRFDGTLTLAQIKSVMASVSVDAFLRTVRSLQDANLIAVAQADRFELELDAQLRMFAPTGDSPEATAGMLSLRKSGYFVEIAREQSTPRQPDREGALTAVVVEDEPVLAKFINTYLALEGFEVRLATNRAEVVQQFNLRPVPDIVLLDVALPDANGFEILARLRQHKAFALLPVIMLTGMATREAVIRGIEGGANGYVTKPFQPDALMRAVRTVLGLPEPKPTDLWEAGDGVITRRQHRPPPHSRGRG